MYFLALSQAPPEFDRKFAMSWPVRMVRGQEGAEGQVADAEADDDRREDGEQGRGDQLALGEPRVQMSMTRPYSGFSVQSMIPGCSRNWRRTSWTTVPAERPTARMARREKRNATEPPMSRPMKIVGLRR